MSFANKNGQLPSISESRLHGTPGVGISRAGEKNAIIRQKDRPHISHHDLAAMFPNINILRSDRGRRL